MAAFNARETDGADPEISSFPTLLSKLPLSSGTERTRHVSSNRRPAGHAFAFSAASYQQ